MKRFFLFPAILTAALLCACTVIPERPASPMEETQKPDSAGDIRLGNTLLSAIRADDFRAFHACLANGPAAKMTDRDFRTSRENILSQFGKIRDFRYLTALQTPSVRNRIWIVTFERKGADGRTITQEVLFRLVCGTPDGRTVILGFGFL